MRKILILELIILIFFVACSRKNLTTGKLKSITDPPISKKIGKPDSTYQIVMKEKGINTINIQYLGCGGLLIEKNQEKVLIDPFFSNQGLVRVGLSSVSKYLKDIDCDLCDDANSKTKRHKGRCIKPNVDLVNKYIVSGIVNVTGVKSILVTHAHYDHLLDLPHIYNTFLKKKADTIKILASESTYKLTKKLIDSTRFIPIEDNLTTYQKMGMVENLNDNGTIKVWPVLSDHAPHFESIKLFDGEVCNTIKDPIEYYEGTHAHWWREGKTIDYLLEFINKDIKDTFRIFIQSSASCPKYGFLPDDYNKRIDLAVLGIASYQYACDYPDTCIKRLNPSQILMVHWEDFFLRYDRKKGPKTVRGTDVKKFLLEYKTKGNKPLHMVEPLTNITIKY